MKINELEIRNFRNIKNLKVKFKNNLNIFIGKNAQGKTSILESIFFLAITKSHRTNIDKNMIMNNELFSKVVGKIENKEESKDKIEILLKNNGKKVQINYKNINKLSDYISKLPVIIFSPNDIEILTGSPQERRKYLNISISQLNKEYLYYLNIYNKILKQRNEYLKNKKVNDEIYFEILTQKFIEINLKIIIFRNIYINRINKNINKIFNKLTGEKGISVQYETIIKNFNISQEEIKRTLENKFKKVKDSEKIQQTTLFGAHRDDFIIRSNEKDIKEYFSQGLQKLALLSLKLSELKIYIEDKKDIPIILLDDIFSELDSNKKNKIMKYFLNDTQTFITTIDLKNINLKYIKKADIFKIKNGNIVKTSKEEKWKSTIMHRIFKF